LNPKTEKLESLEERKAEILIKLRAYKLIKKQKHDDAISYLVDMPKEKQKALIWCIPGEATVGVASINRLTKLMKDQEIENGLIVTDGRYTHTVKAGAKKKNIELLPKTFPAFNLFENKSVPKHEILTEEQQRQLVTGYKIHPYQLPQISSQDPAVKVIGAKPGDVVRVIRKSSTAGEHIAYRYVVEQ
jgi:DNA-directed RNA polymerase subunit H